MITMNIWLLSSTSSKQVQKLCSILKTFCNRKKILINPPHVVHNKLVSFFKAKSNLLNNYFALLYTPLEKDNCLYHSSKVIVSKFQ